MFIINHYFSASKAYLCPVFVHRALHSQEQKLASLITGLEILRVHLLAPLLSHLLQGNVNIIFIALLLNLINGT